MAALRGRRADRPPLAHVSALTTVELQQATGCHLPAAHHDAEQQARLLAANHDVLGFDAVSFILNYFGEPAALVRRSTGARPSGCRRSRRILGSMRKTPAFPPICSIGRR